MQLTVFRETLDSHDLSALGLNCEQSARLDGLAVEIDRASTAVGRLAADMTAGVPKLLAQHVNEQFPWFGKQSVMCVGDSVERQIAFVDFTNDEVADAFGTVEIDAAGKGTGSFTVPTSELRTGHVGRDEKLQGGAWHACMHACALQCLHLRCTAAVRTGAAQIACRP